MQQKNELEIVKSVLGEVVVEFYRATIAFQKETLVHPVGYQEEHECCWVHNREPARVKECNSQHDKHIRVAIFKYKIFARVNVLVILLNNLLRFSSITGATSVATTTTSAK